MNAGDTFYKNTTIAEIFSNEHTADFIVGIAKIKGGYWKPARKDFSFQEVFLGHGANHQSTFISSEVFACNLYDTRYRYQADDFFFLDNVVFRGRSYEAIDDVVAFYDMTGVSNAKHNSDALATERLQFLTEHLPPRILQDYYTPVHKKVINEVRTFFKKAKRYSLRRLKIALHID